MRKRLLLSSKSSNAFFQYSKTLICLDNRTTRFATFPEVLVINAQRFTEDWVAQKLEVPIIVPYKSLSLDKYIGTGKQAHEVALPEDTVGKSSSSYYTPEAHYVFFLSRSSWTNI